MTVISFSILLLISIVSFQPVLGSDGVFARDVALQDLAVTGRSLKAAQRGEKLGRRDVKGCLRHDHQLHYLDADSIRSDSQFGAKLGMQFKTPTLLLEDIEHHVETIACSKDGIHLHFLSEESLAHAQEEFRNVNAFFLISSHEGCNADGERDPYLVTESAVNVESRIIILTASRIPWKHTFDSWTLDFGESNEQLHPRQHAELRPRQAAASSSAASSAAATTSIDYPAAPSSTATSLNVTGNVDHSYIDTMILPPDQSLGQLSVSGPKISGGINVKCKNCTFHGSINLVAGSLTMGPFTSNTTNGFINETEAVADYIRNGFVEFRADGLGAHVELDNTIEATDKLISWTVPLPTIPITPLLIPGIASVGPEFEPALTTGFQLKANLEFGTGFEVSIPDNSSLILNLANRNDSSQQGFDDTKVTALPFQASTPSVELTLSASFSPRLLLGISFFSGSATAGAGFFLNTPSISTTLSTVTHVDSQCENVSNSSSAASERTFDALTHIDSSVEVALGVIAQAEVDFEGSGRLKDEAEYTVLGKTFDLPTACVGFDAAAKTYGAPAQAVKTGSGMEGPKASANSAVGTKILLGVGDEGFGRLAMALGAVMAVFVLF